MAEAVMEKEWEKESVDMLVSVDKEGHAHAEELVCFDCGTKKVVLIQLFVVDTRVDRFGYEDDDFDQYEQESE